MVKKQNHSVDGSYKFYYNVSFMVALIWGEFWIFCITAVVAMVFDAQFIVIQRYNRPRVIRLIEKTAA